MQNLINPMSFANFAIRLRDLNRGYFKVEVVHSPAGRMRTPDLVRFDREIIPYLKKRESPYVEGEMIDEEMIDEEMIEMGEMLGDMLLPATVRRMFVKSWKTVHSRKKRRGLRLLLEVDDARLAVVPWEYVYSVEYLHIR